MALATTTVALIGLGIAAAGTGITIAGQAQASAATQKAEQIRKKAANLDVLRKRREAIRNAQFAQAQAEVAATNQGAQFGSVLPGAEAGIQGQLNYNEKSIGQDKQIGNKLAGTNAQRAQGDAVSGIGSGIASLGGQVVNNAQTIGRVGTYETSSK